MFLKVYTESLFKLIQINSPLYILINQSLKNLSTKNEAIDEKDKKDPSVNSKASDNILYEKNSLPSDLKRHNVDDLHALVSGATDKHYVTKVEETDASNSFTTSHSTKNADYIHPNGINSNPILAKNAEISQSVPITLDAPKNEPMKLNKSPTLNDYFQSKQHRNAFMTKLSAIAQNFPHFTMTDNKEKLPEANLTKDENMPNNYTIQNTNFKDTSSLQTPESSSNVIPGINIQQNSIKKRKSKKGMEITFGDYTKMNKSICAYTELFEQYFESSEINNSILSYKDEQMIPKYNHISPKNMEWNLPTMFIPPMNLPSNDKSIKTEPNLEKKTFGDAEFKKCCDKYQTYFTEQREFAFTNIPLYYYILNGKIDDFDFIFDLVFDNKIPKTQLSPVEKQEPMNIYNFEQKLLNFYNFPKIQTLNEFASPPIDLSFVSNDNDERRDLKDHFTFSLDQRSGNIMEDAFSYRKDIFSNTEEFGLHTIDIAHALKYFPTEEAKALFLSLAHYFPYNTVQRMFNQDIVNSVSLNSAGNNFTLSMIVKYVDGEFASFWVGKAIINIDVSLSFKDASKFLIRKDIKYSSDNHQKAHQAILAYERVINKKQTQFSSSEDDASMVDYNEVMEHMFPILKYIFTFFNNAIETNFFNNFNSPIPISSIFNFKYKKQLQVNSLLGSKKYGGVNLANPYMTHFTSPLRRYSDIIIQKFIHFYTKKEANTIIEANFGILMQLIFWTNIRLLQGYHIKKEMDILSIIQEFKGKLNYRHLVTKNYQNIFQMEDKSCPFRLGSGPKTINSNSHYPSFPNYYLKIQKLNHRCLDTYEIFLDEIPPIDY